MRNILAIYGISLAALLIVGITVFGIVLATFGLGAMGLAFGTKIMTFEAPLILETEPILIRPGE